MGYKLSTRSLSAKLKKVPDAGHQVQKSDNGLLFLGSKPEDVSEELYADFARFLQAKKPSDIADISNERIIAICKRIGTLADTVNIDNKYTNGSVLRELMRAKAVKKKRRVL